MHEGEIHRSRREKFKRKKIEGLLWFFGTIYCIHAILYLLPGVFIKGFWDYDYVIKSESLRTQIMRAPDRPLWLVCGSSRVMFGLRPALFADRMQAKNAPLVYNFGLLGADLFRQLICVKRLIGEGVRPRRVGIEIHNALLTRAESSFVELPTLIPKANWNEINESRKYSMEPARFLACWFRSRFDPTFSISVKVDHPPLFSKQQSNLDDWGAIDAKWIPSEKFDRATYLIRLEYARKEYEEDFKRDFIITRNNDRALREIIELCKSVGSDVFLLAMPEAPEFQAFYQPRSNSVVQDYLRQIETEYGIYLIDARSWLPDSEDFGDGHHLSETGSVKFSNRLFDELKKAPKPGLAVTGD